MPATFTNSYEPVASAAFGRWSCLLVLLLLPLLLMLSLLFWNSARPGAAPSPAPARNVKEFLPHVLRPTFHNHTHTYAHPTPTPPTALTSHHLPRPSRPSSFQSRPLLSPVTASFPPLHLFFCVCSFFSGFPGGVNCVLPALFGRTSRCHPSDPNSVPCVCRLRFSDYDPGSFRSTAFAILFPLFAANRNSQQRHCFLSGNETKHCDCISLSLSVPACCSCFRRRDIAAQIRASSDSGDRSRLLLCRCLQLCHCYQQYRIVFEPTSQSTFAE
ncbi:uncharacterized protein CTRU02_210109 [Colletotrichum truncatum]|uniref:Uncharacterized protein n=1 Tax=Colletotrichum truncatum TaxID=5467 RepID=A0ACC3YUB8_COLTU